MQTTQTLRKAPEQSTTATPGPPLETTTSTCGFCLCSSFRPLFLGPTASLWIPILLRLIGCRELSEWSVFPAPVPLDSRRTAATMVQRTHFRGKTSFLVPTFPFYWPAKLTQIKTYAATRNV